MKLRRFGRKGNILLEFAIGSSLLLSLFTATFQFGFTFYRYNTLYNAVRNGAHYASMKAYDSQSATPSTAFSAAVQNMVVYGTPNPDESDNLVVPGLSPGSVTVEVAFANGVPSTVTVGVTSFQVDAVFKRYTFSSKPRITFPFLGRYSPP
ncbi:MAG: pilus assembly protein [Acidobacteria bacterium]|nr:pilus assembly protein [Acidobacteriota bacterium]